MDSWLVTLSLFVGALGAFYIFLIWNLGSWKKRGVPEAKSYPGIGTFPSLFTQKRNVVYDYDEVYRQYRSTNKFVGVYNGREPQLFILDPDLVHRIHVNDFKHFHDNALSDTIDEKSDAIVGNNPFFLRGEEWKERRNELVPGMSPNRIKNVYPVTLEICKRLTDFIRQQAGEQNNNGIGAYELFLRYTTEVLARNPRAQEKLREEILSNINEEGFVSFESLSEMPYLDACFNEAIRLFSPLSANTKLCTQPYEFVNSDGTSFQMKKGEIVFISYRSIHHDERYYKNPEEYIPERFLPENGGVKKFREEGKYLGFGDGPRICMGMRFGATQAKAAIVEIIRNFHVKVNSKTSNDNLLDKHEIVAVLDGGIWLDFTPIN
ncbi:probable cytochrome P450 28d1 [Musca vetustissima]|uniref:probable cytochrome P450 28d1 n=1 Tax=Musca vetustissima TaxID=27455 RepID=UPI002AB714E5|nr:probable cytochrome P450 28d1 [Musca vetustissima]